MPCRNRNLSFKIKSYKLNMVVKAVLLYGTATWRHTKLLLSELHFLIKCVCRLPLYRQTQLNHWPKLITSGSLWRQTKWKMRRSQNVINSIKRQALAWNIFHHAAQSSPEICTPSLFVVPKGNGNELNQIAGVEPWRVYRSPSWWKKKGNLLCPHVCSCPAAHEDTQKERG